MVEPPPPPAGPWKGVIVSAPAVTEGSSIPSLLEHLRRVMAELREIGRQVPG